MRCVQAGIVVQSLDSQFVQFYFQHAHSASIPEPEGKPAGRYPSSCKSILTQSFDTQNVEADSGLSHLADTGTAFIGDSGCQQK